MDSVSRHDRAGGSVAQVAAELLACLRAAAPDVGDDATQVRLDDVLENLDARLVRLAGDVP